ncbi:NAD(P)-dependent dehydrogenase (short-subunit alcohol dehydrogenase family) [Microbacterium halimionae]|uniref:NAD(P)-dependent dehydrogenase (Short-subunit alcohol dehydrogenase family) n=1 Tax=Microbacterium halimionae TaxID=1526413 RepID=A0A7W3JQC2_9MICO|nr:SDR family oxidoreductase [Microbacterium halimionae]MBA8817028.1 NAD(P)-dependent dehydrogenase (short-subunit alcohol dehydrogenase family) [Microbacterium halimionae]NII94433.1 NAD(P)-dependent dehydrogenase (short-subunit alcohol dehydrogenase family) [Microbacterium halimionae]
MNIEKSVALVTGANRGIGRSFVEELLVRGVSKVYATARHPETIRVDDPRVVPLRLDLLDQDSIAEAAKVASDVTLLINNAGITTGADLLTAPFDDIRTDLETHLFGTLRVTRALLPALRHQNEAVIVNVLSVLSWVATAAGSGSYSVAKAAEWNMSNGIRVELAGQNILVQGVHLGGADTDMMAGVEGPKIDPADVARASLDGVEASMIEVLVDDPARFVKAALGGDPSRLYG